jgi:iron complex outermembrane receptor protein
MTPTPVAQPARKVCARASGFRSRSGFFLFALAAPLTAFAADPQPPAPPTVVRDAGEVSVVATRGERNLLDVPAHVTVLDRAAIERSGAASLPELLRGEAGIGVSNTTTNAEGYTVEARGFLNGSGSGCRTLVLVDGRRVNEPDTGCVDWTFLGLDQIERVEVIRGPGSAAYGDNALGGVIAIFTRGASAEGGTLAALSAERASFDAERVDALVSQRFGALRLGASAAFDDTSGYRMQADLNNKRAGVDLAWELVDGGELGLAAGYASSERSRPGALDPGVDPRASSRALDFAREREHFVRGSAQLSLPAELELRATPYYRHSQARNHFDNRDPVFPFVFDSAVDHDSAGLDLQVSRDVELLGLSARLLAGAELRQDEIDVATSDNFSGPGSNAARREIWGVFVQAEAWLRDDVLISLGLRRDRSDLEGRSTQFPGTRFDKEHGLWSPRASLTWRFHESASAYVSYGRGFRFPNVDETFGFFGFSPTLSPERAHSVETGASWRSERLEIRGAFYAMWVKDEMFFDPFNGFGQNVNLDEVRHEGGELSGRFVLFDWLHASASYTRDDVKVTRDSAGQLAGEQLPITPKNRGQVALEAALPLGIEARLAGTFVGDRRVANDPLGAVADLAGYATLDARVAYTLDLAQDLALTLEANGRNLTGSEYADFAGFSIFSFPPATRFYPAAQANWSVGARIRFER